MSNLRQVEAPSALSHLRVAGYYQQVGSRGRLQMALEYPVNYDVVIIGAGPGG